MRYSFNPKERPFLMHLCSSFPDGTNELENPGMNTPDQMHDSMPGSLNTRKTRLCIFVVEDDHSVPGLINTVLENWCYHLGMARNGREGLDAVMNMRSTEFCWMIWICICP